MTSLTGLAIARPNPICPEPVGAADLKQEILLGGKGVFDSKMFPLSFSYEKTDTGMVPTSDTEGPKSI